MGRGTLTPQEEALKKEISRNIRNLIKKLGISQAEFSRRTSIPPTTLSGYVKEVTRPNSGNIQKMADAFGILKSEIDPSFKEGYSLSEWKNDKIIDKEDTTIDKITSITNKLTSSRQEKVLDYAEEQLKEQEKITSLYKNEKVYTEDDLDRMARKAVAFGGGELTDSDLEFLKDYLRNNTDKIKEE
ncbi:helix-turn-helix transcriptional regulator [Lactococcus raffinolactis]|uniref:helix-turn-helix domain-containing protein n=1 Tax=Pseudolactococcus raffinolactis TaxID=1366 RepID=UPI00288E3EDC|nr:helix-turn-helix transcriptional regulator [Lactococcus raffinolactis]MDT2766513.1 helix-turn-helix transcriptional regulator [Lactococcus raffinolactis]MDT2789673.1 helix-turn-helix transcriptional regulator [Lactococcus raffinolactis]